MERGALELYPDVYRAAMEVDGITPAERVLLSMLWIYAPADGVVAVTLEQLVEITGYSGGRGKPITQARRRLVDRGLISTYVPFKRAPIHHVLLDSATHKPLT